MKQSAIKILGLFLCFYYINTVNCACRTSKQTTEPANKQAIAPTNQPTTEPITTPVPCDDGNMQISFKLVYFYLD